MNMSAFARGICVGAVAGAVVEMVMYPRPKSRKTAVGKTMERMGNAMDSALDTVSQMTK